MTRIKGISVLLLETPLTRSKCISPYTHAQHLTRTSRTFYTFAVTQTIKIPLHLDPSGEVDEVEVVTLGGRSEGQGHNVDLSTSQGQGHSNQVTSEWTASPNNVPVDFDLESDLEDEGLELFEDGDFRSVDADETFDIDDDDEELIRGMLKFHF